MNSNERKLYIQKKRSNEILILPVVNCLRPYYPVLADNTMLTVNFVFSTKSIIIFSVFTVKMSDFQFSYKGPWLQKLRHHEKQELRWEPVDNSEELQLQETGTLYY